MLMILFKQNHDTHMQNYSIYRRDRENRTSLILYDETSHENVAELSPSAFRDSVFFNVLGCVFNVLSCLQISKFQCFSFSEKPSTHSRMIIICSSALDPRL